VWAHFEKKGREERGAGGLHVTLALPHRLRERRRSSFLEGDAPSAPKLQVRSAVCKLPVPRNDERREKDPSIERCASGGPIRQGRLRRESGTTRRSSLHCVFDGHCRAECACGVAHRSWRAMPRRRLLALRIFPLTEPRGTRRSFKFSARQHFRSDSPLCLCASVRDPRPAPARSGRPCPSTLLFILSSCLKNVFGFIRGYS